VPLTRHDPVRGAQGALEPKRACEATERPERTEALEQPHGRRAAGHHAPIAFDEMPAGEAGLLGERLEERRGARVAHGKERELFAPVEPGDDPRRPAAEASVAVVEQHGATKLGSRHVRIVGVRSGRVLAKFAFSWLSNIVALFLAALIVPGIDYGDDFWVLVLAGLVFALVNLVIRPLVILLALPAIILTLGLALLLVNTFMLYLTDWIVPDFETGSFWSTLGGALIIWLVNLVIDIVFRGEREDGRPG
jgi:putative membrane protein